MTKRKKTKKKKNILPVLAVLITVLLAAVVLEGKLLFDNYLWFAGGLLAKDSVYADYRGKSITIQEYDEITAKLPDCTILWNVPFQGKLYPSDSAQIAVTSLTSYDAEILARYFPKLSAVNATGCRDYAVLEQFHENNPGCALTYQVDLGGIDYANSVESITVPNANGKELLEKLKYLPMLAQAELTGELPDSESLYQLQVQYPDVFFFWQFRLGGKSFSSTVQNLNLSGMNLTYAQVSDVLRSMPNLQSVDLRDCGLSSAELMELTENNPHCKITWEITVSGMKLMTDATEINLSGSIFGNVEEVEQILPYFPNLERVIMCNCGFSNETMDALNRKYENIRFVWSFTIQGHEIRTDATYFYPYKMDTHMFVNDAEIYPLRYCTDMICIDIGHNSGVSNCEWAAFMPNLKYLIIIETSITDISPLSGLKNLVFLEIFSTKITDYSPLLGCTGLEDLNLGNTYGDEAPILQMTWLKNIWWSGIEGSYGLPCSDAPQKLREALPNTYMKFNLENPNVGNGWRHLQNYIDMRHLLDMVILD